ncbi:MAG: alpha/beta hydrolase-fold protein [Opitutus sp.]
MRSHFSLNQAGFRRDLSRFVVFLLGVVGLVLTSGCSLLVRPTTTPITTKWIRLNPEKQADTLVLFLPGRGSVMSEFEDNGFVDTLRRAGVHADVVITDAHLGYYMNRTVIDRLAADVLEPARARGYQRIVSVGISLGGLGALLCQRDQPQSLDAIVLMAPYLGDQKSLFRDIDAAGGPALWAKNRPLRGGEVDEQIWTYLGQHANELPPTWLASGREDRLAKGQNMLATLLPANRVLTIEGRHTWKTWRALWTKICEESEVFAVEKRG